jgi:hypothetical protein
LEQRAAAQSGYQWGFIEPQFDEPASFSKGLTWVKIGDKWGYIDKTGKYVWHPTN